MKREAATSQQRQANAMIFPFGIFIEQYGRICSSPHYQDFHPSNHPKSTGKEIRDYFLISSKIVF